MLLRHTLSSARPTSLRWSLCSRRTIFIESVQALSDAYLDLAIALPFPPTWPVYSSTVILISVVSRLTLFPVFIWARDRERRVEELVIPYLKAYNKKLEEKVCHKVARSTDEAVRDHYVRIIGEKMKKKRSELFREHHCNPLVTIIVPTISQIPIFVTISAVFFRAANGPCSVLRDEAFLTLTSLSHPDPTATLPIILGLVSLASVETSQWFATEAQARRLAIRDKREQTQRARGETVVNPSKYVKSVLRALSVGRIIIAAMMPGAIEVYWLTSATFGLVQNWTLSWLDHRREAAQRFDASSTRNKNRRLRHEQTSKSP